MGIGNTQERQVMCTWQCQLCLSCLLVWIASLDRRIHRGRYCLHGWECTFNDPMDMFHVYESLGKYATNIGIQMI